jgi:N utilization substance protein B
MNEVALGESINMVLEEAATERETPVSREDLAEIAPFVNSLVEGAVRHKTEIDSLLERYLKGWKVERLSKVDLQILRLAVYEMVFRDEVPPKVVINEAIELAKWFGTEDSGKFVNGVLGKMFKELDEVKANRQPTT